VDTDAFKPRQGQKPIDVLWVGRLEEEKRPRLLLEALTHLPGVRAAIIGQGSIKESLHHFAHEKGLDIEWAGSRPHSEIAEWMNRSSVYAITSRYEGHPKTLLEAMSSGMACVGVAVRGIQEEILHEQTGLLCSDQPEDLARTLRRLLDDPAQRSRLGDEARQRVMDRYALPQVAKMELDLLTTMLAGDA
jgi:glycosyltransferase involved in cell wall biosynthesis